MSDLFGVGEIISEYRHLQLMLCAGLGLAINLSLAAAGQTWARLRSQRYTSVLLPPAGAIITWTIGSNLALSLGMIGALSIVRFRTPVKNPFELVVFFCYLILGISCGVEPLYAITLGLMVMLTPPLVGFLDKILVFKNKRHPLQTKIEFAYAPVQAVLQYKAPAFTLLEGLNMDDVISMSSQHASDQENNLVDVTLAFGSKEEAMSCLNKLDQNQLIYSSLNSTEH